MNIKIKNQIKQLIKEINKHDNLYFNNQTNEISDGQYEQLYNQLLKLEKQYPEHVYKSSPTQKIQVLPNNIKTIQHKTPVLGIKKCFYFEDLFKFIDKIKKKLQ